jgi:hypothetical protein
MRSDCTFAHSPKELRQEGQRTEASKTPQYGPGTFKPGYLPPEIGEVSPLWRDLHDGPDSKGSAGGDGLTKEIFRERFETLSLSLGGLGFAEPLKSAAVKDAFVPAAPRFPAAPPPPRLVAAPPRLETMSLKMESSPDASKVPLPMSPLMPSPTGSSAGYFLPVGVLED